MTLENVRENLIALRKMKVKVIDFTGGEPLLHRELPAFLKLAKDLGFITTVTTNALLYPKYGDKLKGLVDMLHFSLDSIDKDKHNASRRVDCYDHLIESIQLAKSYGEQPDILFTVTPDNIHEVEAVIRRFVGQEKLMVILNPIFAYNGVGEDLSQKDLDRLEQWGRQAGVYLNEAFVKLRRAGGNRVEDPICKAGSSTVVISPQNELLLPCYHLSQQAFPIEGNLAEVYQSPEAQLVVAQEGRLPACDGCVVNCYMEPSLALETGRYFWTSLKSTLKYSLEKWVYQV